MNTSTANTQNDLSPYIDTSWEPTSVSSSKSLAAVIVSDDFQDSLEEMLDEYDSMIPTEHYDDGSAFISLSARRELMERHFPFGTFHISTQFIKLDSDTPICVATLYVLTDDSYEAWFSRMGMGTASSVSSDGLFADAETSALRRILTAIGLGNEGNEESADSDRINRVGIVDAFIESTSQTLIQLVESFKSHGSKYSLGALTGFYPSSKDKKDDRERFGFNSMNDNDLALLVSYVQKKISESKK